VAYQLAITERLTYLHIVATGEKSRDTVCRYMGEVMHECTRRNYPRVLIEARLQGPRLGTIDLFTLVAKGSLRYMGVLKSMAYVDVYASGDGMKFAENVAVNRAFPLKVFSSVTAAERWLTGGPAHVAAPPGYSNYRKPGC